MRARRNYSIDVRRRERLLRSAWRDTRRYCTTSTALHQSIRPTWRLITAVTRGGVRRLLVKGVNAPLAAKNCENLTTKWRILKYIRINMWSA